MTMNDCHDMVPVKLWDLDLFWCLSLAFFMPFLFALPFSLTTTSHMPSLYSILFPLLSLLLLPFVYLSNLPYLPFNYIFAKLIRYVHVCRAVLTLLSKRSLPRPFPDYADMVRKYCNTIDLMTKINFQTSIIRYLFRIRILVLSINLTKLNVLSLKN